MDTREGKGWERNGREGEQNPKRKNKELCDLVVPD
jgi:hypothetical protein